MYIYIYIYIQTLLLFSFFFFFRDRRTNVCHLILFLGNVHCLTGTEGKALQQTDIGARACVCACFHCDRADSTS